MICNKCNRNLPDDSVFCQHCGSEINNKKELDDVSNEKKNAEREISDSIERVIEIIPKRKTTNKVRYCKECGHLIDSQTCICTGCKKRYMRGLKHYFSPAPNKLEIFNFAFDICLVIYSCIMLLQIVFSWVIVDVEFYPTFVYGRNYPQFPWVLFTGAFSFLLILFGMSSLVYSIRIRVSTDKKLRSILRFIASIVISITTIVAMMPYVYY